MNDELAILRKLAANPYDRGTLGAYADWLREQGRQEEEAGVRRLLAAARPATLDANSMTVGELVGLLLEMPADAVVIYNKHSDYSEMRPDEVKLIRAEDKKLIRREQNGYSEYRPDWWPEQAGIESPNFVTVCNFPGN